jgi:hypothetical protein
MFQLIVTIVALSLISVTMLVRANDLGKRVGLKWHVRRAGFVTAGFSPVGIVLKLIYGLDPSMYWSMFSVGVTLVFMTTPYLPPWWRWIQGQDAEGQSRRSTDRKDEDKLNGPT